MQALKQQRACLNKWYIVAFFQPGNKASWAFDRWRLYYPGNCTQVTVAPAFYAASVAQEVSPDVWEISHASMMNLKQGGFTKGVQQFSNDLNYEHTFDFDLSDAGDLMALIISTPPASSEFRQVYAYPSGFGGSRGYDAQISEWYLTICNPENYFRMENQPISSLLFGDGTPVLNADYVLLMNNILNPSSINNAVIGCDNNGKWNGTFDHTGGESRPGNVAYDAWKSLEAKNWTLKGVMPSPPAVNGCVLLLDASSSSSYNTNNPTDWYDISGNNNTFTIEAGVTWDANGYFVMNDANGFYRNSNITTATTGTVVMWIQTTDTQALFLSDGSAYLGAYRVGNKEYHATMGSNIRYFQDLTEQPNIYDHLRDGAWHMVEFKGVDLNKAKYEISMYGAYQFDSSTKIGQIRFYDHELTAQESQYLWEQSAYYYGLQ